MNEEKAAIIIFSVQLTVREFVLPLTDAQILTQFDSLARKRSTFCLVPITFHHGGWC
jgi:hypothetical protein